MRLPDGITLRDGRLNRETGMFEFRVAITPDYVIRDRARLVVRLALLSPDVSLDELLAASWAAPGATYSRAILDGAVREILRDPEIEIATAFGFHFGFRERLAAIARSRGGRS